MFSDITLSVYILLLLLITLTEIFNEKEQMGQREIQMYSWRKENIFFAFSLYATTFGIVFVFCMNFHPNSHVLYNLSAKSASF